ncbi:zinc finger protein 337-like [Armigeres subalbatus]|uniref:zinc finger protein 337-like n=1 Tax=Armigeres subalbatus TaxID=124917 RepID=UPI002ED09C0B
MSENIFCRTCGRGGLICFVPLLHVSDVFSETVLRMIEFGIGLKFSSGDGFPQHVCQMCYGQILVSYELKRASVESQSCFQRMFPLAGADTSDERLQDVPMQEIKLEPEEIPIIEDSSKLEANLMQDSVYHTGYKGQGRPVLFQQNTQLKRKIYSCKYCPYKTFHRMAYMFHYKTHPKALRCVCGLVTDRKFTLQRHLAKFDCESLYGKKVNFTTSSRKGRRRKANTIIDQTEQTSESVPEKFKFEVEEITIIDEIPKLEETFSNPEDGEWNSVSETLPFKETESESNLIIGAGKLELDEISMTEPPMELEGECSIKEGTYNTVLEYREEHVLSDEASLEHDINQMRKLYECKFCPYTTTQRSEYMSHYKKHPNAVMCVCGFWTDRRYTLQRHLITMGCEEIYGTKVNLGPSYRPYRKIDKNNGEPIQDQPESLRIYTSRRQKYFKCRICSQTTDDRQTHMEHLKTHPKAPRCVCGFTTDLKSTLQLHVEYSHCEDIFGEKVDWEYFIEGQISNNEIVGIVPKASKSVQKRKVYKCDHCSYIGDNRMSYMSHYKTHPTAFRCVCGFATDRKFSLQRHLVNWNCETIFGTKVDLDAYEDHRKKKRASSQQSEKNNDGLIGMGFTMRITRNLRMFYCCKEECQGEYDSEEQCAEHFEQNHKTDLLENLTQSQFNKFTCKSCHLTFADEMSLSVHRDNLYRPLFQCNNCGKDGLSRKTAMLHSKSVCKVNRFSCSCGFLTNELSALKDHFQPDICNEIRIESDANQPGSSKLSGQKDGTSPMTGSTDERHICKNCGIERNNHLSLQKHLRIEVRRALREQSMLDRGKAMDGIPGKVYTCRWCNEPTNNLQHLVKCMCDAKECATCRKRFTNIHLLTLHLKRECKTRNIGFQCPFCENRFSHVGRLNRHISRDHSKKKCTKV